MVRTLTLVVFLVLAMASSTWAAEYASVPTQPLLGTTPRLASPPGPVYSQGMPSPQRPPIDAHHGQFGHGGVPIQQTVPGAGWSGYGFGGVPTYQWGYFGAHYRPVNVYHRGYYGHRMSFGYRRGY